MNYVGWSSVELTANIGRLSFPSSGEHLADIGVLLAVFCGVQRALRVVITMSEDRDPASASRSNRRERKKQGLVTSYLDVSGIASNPGACLAKQ